MRATTIFLLAVSLSVALLLQLLSCILWSNWWPLLTGAVYVLVPMPFLLLSGGGAETGTWVDVAKFLTGFGAVLVVGVPVVLAHAKLIVPDQLALALPSAVLLGGTACAYDWLSRSDGDLYASLL